MALKETGRGGTFQRLTLGFPLAAFLPAILLVLASATWVVLWRRHQHQRYYTGVAARMSQRFPCLDDPLVGGTLPLRSPPGEVAVRPDGIHVKLTDGGVAHVMVPWSDIQHVLPTGRGEVQVHISGVGDLSVSGVASRQIWDVVSASRVAGRAPLPGRA